MRNKNKEFVITVLKTNYNFFMQMRIVFRANHALIITKTVTLCRVAACIMWQTL